MRILQVISSSATSGAERHVFSLSHLLQQQGHWVEVVCPKGGWLPQALRTAGVPVYESDMKGAGWFRTTGYVMKRIRAGRIDLVHSHLTRATYFGAVSGALRGVPAVASVHVGNHDQIYKRMARGRNKLIAVSNYVRGLLHGRGISDRHIETVYNGTDFLGFEVASADEVKRELGLSPDKRVIGLIGRVCREKGHLLLIDAMRDVARLHPDAHVLFVGRVEPLFEAEVKQAVADADLEDRITMTGVRYDVPRLMDACEFTTMPSHQETFGVAAIEAMARSRAVVASRIGGLPEVVRHGQTGLLVDLRPDELAHAVTYLLEHDDDRRAMGESGRAIVEQKFTLRQMAQTVEAVYRRTLETG